MQGEEYTVCDFIDEKAVEWSQEAKKLKELKEQGSEDVNRCKQIEFRMQSLRNQIAEKLLDKVYPSFQKNKDIHMKEKMHTIFMELIFGKVLNIQSKSAYDPEKGSSFYAYFKTLLAWREKDVYQERKKETKNLSEQICENDREAWREFVDTNKHSVEKQVILEMTFREDFRRLITELAKALGSMKKRDCLYAIFTFYTIKETEDEKQSADQLITQLYIKDTVFVFPLMLIGFVVYLKGGSKQEYQNMRDIIDKELKEGIDLAQKQKLIGNYLHVTRQTVSSYEKIYASLGERLKKKMEEEGYVSCNL